ncbi:SDR family NAD(P)-dependent oxidoreductase [Companilactobacillus sp. HBUAS56257]|uniref:SDR family NAD(P)-dependent oxidoreductase n=1 Tax=Companilactobacillus sp. HBUAS56257 TaxID=3109360 RepID=UPI002FF25BA7
MTTVVIGADSGVGLEIAKVYGKHDQKIILVSRDQKKLDAATKLLNKEHIAAANYVCDVNDFASTDKMLQNLVKQDQNINNLVFNVGNKHLDNALSSTVDLIEEIFETNVLSAINAAKSFIESSNPNLPRSIIFTGGGAAIRPSDKASTLSLTKAALRSYAYTLHEDVAPDDIFVGLVTIQGIIGSSDLMAPEKIAPIYWDLLKERDKTEAFYPEHVSQSEFE